MFLRNNLSEKFFLQLVPSKIKEAPLTKKTNRRNIVYDQCRENTSNSRRNCSHGVTSMS